MTKVNSVDFLKEKGLIKEGFTEFVIVGEFGSINLTELLDEYLVAKRKDSYTEIDKSIITSLVISKTKEIQEKLDMIIENTEKSKLFGGPG